MEDHKQLLFSKSYINGEWVSGSPENFDVLNPADGSLVTKISNGDGQTVSLAIDAAHTAFKPWSKKSAKDRSVIMQRWYSLIIENKEHIAKIMTLESGKPINESRGEVDYGASFIQWFAEEAKRLYGDIIPGYTADRRIMVIKQPIGVVGAITPWNFPLAMITRKVAPALAAGCTVVVRPSEETPLTALAIAHLAEKAGFPNGVFNVVAGTDAAAMGKVLCESPLVSKISFTGSTKVGQILSTQCVPTLKKLSLELGGNAPFIVFEDADIDAAIKGAIAGKFRFSGQTCVCVNRILVHEKIYELFTTKFVKAVSELRLGNGMREEVNIGPLINKKAINRVESFIQDAVKKGGKILIGGDKIDDHFFSPTVIGDATATMDFAKEEIFGPVAPIFKFSSDEEAIHLANDTIYGLASYFYTNDLKRSWKISEALEYGIVGINEGLISSEVAPFGGVKYSGSGREGSKYGIEDYIEIKYICIGNID
ncbi:succinate-semialdehyde dehydrogenase/glutarate-semialdehyde dehydrogenase [Pedobacter cryoconitis]|uniref:Succinate-semialdehyde dehydrogenase/glutarate-semialdehyde dehydrogenase n=1 Tax=Pedobacter cryoconitis TaxID=188932 RepID=A0A7W8ZJN7_9SPHI|nr:NAD-dependent succinate-semialdehyde dehydrogenase [Pedobacter cryoconitis]MBB5635193.1 succinate-semialdehyde dehydrogenase/glutarate-semialdehyde dehydrogenase [Pedobacter cryoconitis]MBB6271624.1 succinate-semialdehyde dehydrogenase/glutarate-semialdehyde dehydrogenase [Pedobacter cryoconitis]